MLLCTILVLYVLARTSYHSSHDRLDFFVSSCRWLLLASGLSFLCLNQPLSVLLQGATLCFLVKMFRRRTQHRPDSIWSWFACVCASIYQASSLGFSFSFGIMLPELMKQFDEGRQKTGEWISRKFVLFWLVAAPSRPRSWPAVPSNKDTKV